MYTAPKFPRTSRFGVIAALPGAVVADVHALLVALHAVVVHADAALPAQLIPAHRVLQSPPSVREPVTHL